jgi:DNA phosphorothioation-dependent restriction protein DptG
MTDKVTDKKILLKLRDIRREKGLSMHDLADQAGVGYQKVSRIERGETQITVDMLSRLASVLKVPVSSLLSENQINKLGGEGVDSTVKETDVYIIPAIYEELEKLCDKHRVEVDNSTKIYLATTIFKAVQDIHTNIEDEKEMAKVFFQAFDAIFERLVVNPLNEAGEGE